MQWWRKAAQQGSASAQSGLAQFYAGDGGQAVPHSDVIAYALFKLVLTQNKVQDQYEKDDLVQSLSELAGRMTKQDLAHAETLSREMSAPATC